MSSYLIAAPEALASASADLSTIEEAIRQATATAAPSTTSVLVAAQDEVSAAISELFGSYDQQFQAFCAQARLFPDQFVQSLTSGGNLYAVAEAANAEATAATGVINPFNPAAATPVNWGQQVAALNPFGYPGGVSRGDFVSGVIGAYGNGYAGRRAKVVTCLVKTEKS